MNKTSILFPVILAAIVSVMTVSTVTMITYSGDLEGNKVIQTKESSNGYPSSIFSAGGTKIIRGGIIWNTI